METLRAIPWIFAWTQIRMVLPAWLGIDTALRRLIDDVRLLRLPAAYLQSAAPVERNLSAFYPGVPT